MHHPRESEIDDLPTTTSRSSRAPGRSTVTSRLSPSPHAIARALRGDASAAPHDEAQPDAASEDASRAEPMPDLDGDSAHALAGIAGPSEKGRHRHHRRGHTTWEISVGAATVEPRPEPDGVHAAAEDEALRAVEAWVERAQASGNVVMLDTLVRLLRLGAQRPTDSVNLGFVRVDASDAPGLLHRIEPVRDALAASVSPLSRDQLRTRIEALQVNRDEAGLRELLARLATAQAHASDLLPAALYVAVTAPVSGALPAVSLQVSVSDLGSLHTLATAAALSSSPAAPVGPLVAKADTRTTSVQLWDHNWGNEHLANVDMDMGVAATPGGQIYPTQVAWRAELGAGGAQLGVSADATSVTSNGLESHTVKIDYRFKVTGASSTVTSGGGESETDGGKIGANGVEANHSTTRSRTWSRSDSATAGGTFFRSYLVTYTPDGFRWIRRIAENMPATPISRAGATDLEVTSYDRTEV